MEWTIGEAAAQTGWSARMLRYLESSGLVIPTRTQAGYRLYGLRELNQLRSLRDLRERFGVELDELAFAARLRRDPGLRAAVDTWLAGSSPAVDWVTPDRVARDWVAPDWVDWELRKQQRLLAA